MTHESPSGSIRVRRLCIVNIHTDLITRLVNLSCELLQIMTSIGIALQDKTYKKQSNLYLMCIPIHRLLLLNNIFIASYNDHDDTVIVSSLYPHINIASVFDM